MPICKSDALQISHFYTNDMMTAAAQVNSGHVGEERTSRTAVKKKIRMELKYICISFLLQCDPTPKKYVSGVLLLKKLMQEIWNTQKTVLSN